MPTDAHPSSSPGYAFAFFRSHCLDAERRHVGRWWCAPDCWDKTTKEWTTCECEARWIVSDLYHWHGSDGKCHNAVKCR